MKQLEITPAKDGGFIIAEPLSSVKHTMFAGTLDATLDFLRNYYGGTREIMVTSLGEVRTRKFGEMDLEDFSRSGAVPCDAVRRAAGLKPERGDLD